MNGYSIIADTYKQAVEDGKVKQEEVASKIKALDFLATCTQEDIYAIVDSTALNEVIACYLRCAVRGADVSEEVEKKIISGLRATYADMSCKEVVEKDWVTCESPQPADAEVENLKKRISELEQELARHKQGGRPQKINKSQNSFDTDMVELSMSEVMTKYGLSRASYFRYKKRISK